MIQADSVLSTPRRTAPKIKARPTTVDHIRIDASRVHTYGDLECQVTECFMQAEVAAIVVHDTLSDTVPDVTADQAMAVMHAVYQLVADVRALHAQYMQYFEAGAVAVQS